MYIMSNSDTTGAVAGASTTASGVAAVASGNDFLVILGWIAIGIGLLVLISLLIAMFMKRRNRKEQ